MAITWGQVRDGVIIAMLVAFFALLVFHMFGCTVTLADKGSVSVDFRQGFTIAHQTSTTDGRSVAIWDFKPLKDLWEALKTSGGDAQGEEPPQPE